MVMKLRVCLGGLLLAGVIDAAPDAPPDGKKPAKELECQSCIECRQPIGCPCQCDNMCISGKCHDGICVAAGFLRRMQDDEDDSNMPIDNDTDEDAEEGALAIPDGVEVADGEPVDPEEDEDSPLDVAETPGEDLAAPEDQGNEEGNGGAQLRSLGPWGRRHRRHRRRWRRRHRRWHRRHHGHHHHHHHHGHHRHHH
ncbi:unnamed protein product [Vitrella brassicaformis CCMP3155]|uniref:Uncharacterized protein n=1 Tax=Vitrella brassicaformis (strain CCMP3155) TaxID=1169540 RepID=A0A0G4G6A0_VITBC|nr:unnamed protein product [Vitrella brassicaformis CCMP3155]|eukprot:CEM24051.1 unnamed protein product [Vitrella brassicaformis CCMP3155]